MGRHLTRGKEERGAEERGGRWGVGLEKGGEGGGQNSLAAASIFSSN